MTAPCPWVIQVSRRLHGREVPSIVAAAMLRTKREVERLPTWRLVEVPQEFRTCEPSDILRACLDGRIAWQAAS